MHCNNNIDNIDQHRHRFLVSMLSFLIVANIQFIVTKVLNMKWLIPKISTAYVRQEDYLQYADPV